MQVNCNDLFFSLRHLFPLMIIIFNTELYDGKWGGVIAGSRV